MKSLRPEGTTGGATGTGRAHNRPASDHAYRLLPRISGAQKPGGKHLTTDARTLARREKNMVGVEKDSDLTWLRTPPPVGDSILRRMLVERKNACKWK